MNLTILGGSVGYDAATAWSELHYLKNVYISSLNEAIRINNVTDIGRLENIHISPEYLIGNSCSPVSSTNAANIRQYFRENATGIYIQRSDWEYFYQVDISGVSRGIVLEKYIDTNDDGRVRGSNGQAFDLSIHDCTTAFDVRYTNAIGYALTGVSIADCTNGFLFEPEFMASFEIANLTFSGSVNCPIVMNSQDNGKVTVTNSNFSCQDVTNYAVLVTAGNLSLQQCSFAQNTKHVRVEQNAGSVSVLGCTFPFIEDISRTAGKEKFVLVDDTPLNLPVADFTHTYRRTVPTP